jgi:hypothetical protein
MTGNVNHLAVIVAALSTFLIGGLWYSPVMFYKGWMRANNFSEGQPKTSKGVVFGLSFLLSLLMAYNLAFFISGPETTLNWALSAALLAGFGWAALSLAIIALFEGRPASYIFINGGYITVSFAVMGLILGLWR